MIPLPQSRSEQRAGRRVEVALPGHCRVGTRFLRDTVVDLSREGLFLRTRETPPHGTSVTVAVALPAGAQNDRRVCTLVGSVVRTTRDAAGRPLGVGVQLSAAEMTGADQRLLGHFLGSASL